MLPSQRHAVRGRARCVHYLSLHNFVPLTGGLTTIMILLIHNSMSELFGPGSARRFFSRFCVDLLIWMRPTSSLTGARWSKRASLVSVMGSGCQLEFVCLGD